ncbi:MAG: DUF4402 domain-containing protein [Alphaproteobacteria bacterium]|nr:DUF4402 domain-containing protein [Alphaproteobacteria bacterium]MDE2337402.1 DUF4402 domain-containing protein [Alphaproteobacteria bacterium]
MDLLKALKRTTIISATAVLALGATQAQAITDNVAVLGHISASVQGTLAVAEAGPMNFGNFAISCNPCSKGGDTIVLSDEGKRTKTGSDITFMNGTSASPAGIANGTNYETGAQEPGFYTITQSDGIANVYVSFSDSTGAIIDSNHPNNVVTLTGPTGQTFTVNSFTFETDNTGAAAGSSGYTQAAASTHDSYGNYVPCTTGCTLRVGATLSTSVTAAVYAPGQYTGTYYVMVSY